jgi:mannose-6-phosphate isomerase-like protein (cupin superfamily)
MSEPEPIKLDFRAQAAHVAEAVKPYLVLFERDDVTVELFIPRDSDTQRPHDRDELYVVVSGKGTFRRDRELVRFAPGDVLMVRAHVPHRFESFSGDFKTWVIFFGPKRAKPAAAPQAPVDS